MLLLVRSTRAISLAPASQAISGQDYVSTQAFVNMEENVFRATVQVAILQVSVDRGTRHASDTCKYG